MNLKMDFDSLARHSSRLYIRTLWRMSKWRMGYRSLLRSSSRPLSILLNGCSRKLISRLRRGIPLRKRPHKSQKLRLEMPKLKIMKLCRKSSSLPRVLIQIQWSSSMGLIRRLSMCLNLCTLTVMMMRRRRLSFGKNLDRNRFKKKNKELKQK